MEAAPLPTDNGAGTVAQDATPAAGEPTTLLDGKPVEGKPAEGDGKPADPGKPAEGEGKPAEDEGKPLEGAPEKYEFKPPEGQEYDDQVLGAYSEIAKELNLTQEGAQKLLDKVGPVMQQRQLERLEAVRAEWAETSKTDKEFGGEKLVENLGVARGFLDKFATPEFRQFVKLSGLGNHPEFIRMAYRAGKAVSPDNIVNGEGGTKTKDGPLNLADRASIIYPNS